jgi:pyridoxine kinase
VNVISIQSQVVHGKVGNSVAVPALQAHGLRVAAVPTTLLSNHPHYPTMRGRVLEPELLSALLTGVEERGLIDSGSALLTGFLGSAENGEVVADFVQRAKRRNPHLLYVCDPVCGDDDLGLFVDPDLQRLFVERLLPLADVATPNAWELRRLIGEDDVVTAARALQSGGVQNLVVTGGSTQGSELQTFVFDRQQASRIRTPRLPVRPAGTGDLFTACLTAHLVHGLDLVEAAAAAVASTYATLERTPPEPWAEMPVEPGSSYISTPDHRFTPEPLHA